MKKFSKRTTNRKEYRIYVHDLKDRYGNDCGICPMYRHRRTCRVCNPFRVIQKSWKEHRAKQYRE